MRWLVSGCKRWLDKTWTELTCQNIINGFTIENMVDLNFQLWNTQDSVLGLMPQI